MEKYGKSLKRKVTVVISGFGSFNIKYSLRERSLSNLGCIFKKYMIEPNHFLFFHYLEESKFLLTVFDCHGHDHFRDLNGFLYLHKFSRIPAGSTYIHLSGMSANIVEGDNINQFV